MPLSEKAILEMEESLYELIKLLAKDNPVMRMQLRTIRPTLQKKLIENKDAMVHTVFEPLHAWLHENNIDAVKKTATSVEGALDEMAKHPTN